MLAFSNTLAWLLTVHLFTTAVAAGLLPHYHRPHDHRRFTLKSRSWPVPTSRLNRTINDPLLHTWWHATGEINTRTPVQNTNVRQSHLYNVQVATGHNASDARQYYDSFVYETIPRNGNGKICTPGNLASLCDVDDQITIEADVNITMAWTQFLYSADSVVRISRRDGTPISTSEIVIRPSNLNFTVKAAGGSALIIVPYNRTGFRFSVDFQNDIWTYRNAGPGINSSYVQNVNPGGYGYVSKYTSTMPIVGAEPRNALLIFASPFPAESMVPTNVANALQVKPGLVTNLNETTKSVVYFGPGVYYLTGTAHAILSPTVNWVYFAPGAYVKGAIEYRSSSSDIRATGFGVLSGEQYVYQANMAQNYANIKSDSSSLKMWRSNSTATKQTWTLHGLTVNAPPFNSMDFYGQMDNFSVQASDYKQVGAFFGQTDGLEMYPNSHVHDIFYHSGDDVIKTYYSNVLVERVTVWKTNNAPIIQFGWSQRNLTNITVDYVDVIHSRYISTSIPYPRALIGSSASYESADSTSTASIHSSISNYTVSNMRSEGLSPALIGINPLANVDNFTISDVWIEKLAPDTTGVDMSTFRVFTDELSENKSIALGEASPDNIGLHIKNYYVGKTHITFEDDNWDSISLGRLNVDDEFWGRWQIH